MSILPIDISVVIPVYKSQEILPHLYERLAAVLTQSGGSYEVIFVCDCSPDNSWERLKEIAVIDSNIKPILLRKNAGYDNAIMAGFAHSHGKFVVTMDDDLQHAPEDIPRLLEEINKGYDIVYGSYVHKKQSKGKNFGSWINGVTSNILLGNKQGIYLSPFKIIRREVIQELNKYSGPFPYIDGILFTMTSSISQISITHFERMSGSGNYSFLPSLRIWANHITGFSILPLRVATLIGVFFATISFTYAVFMLINWYALDRTPEGWMTITLGIIFFGGLQLIFTGIIGEYMGRTYLLTSKYPQFIIKETLNMKND